MHILLVGEDAEYRVRLLRDLARSRSSLSLLHVREPSELDLALSERTPDVLVLEDPWFDGEALELLQSIKQARPDVVALLLTPPGSESVVARCLRFGLDGHLLKTPTHRALLAPAIEALLELPAPPRTRTDDGARVLMNRLNFGTFRASLRGRITDASPMFLRMLGIETYEAASGLRLDTLLGDEELLTRMLDQVRLEGSFSCRDVQLQKTDGGSALLSLTAVLSPGPSGESGLVGCLEDPHLQGGHEETAAAARTAWRLLRGSGPALCWTADSQLRIVSVQGSGQEAFGLDDTILHRRPLGELLGEGEAAEELADAHARALGGLEATIGTTWRGKAVQVRVEPLVDDDDAISGVIAVCFPAPGVEVPGSARPPSARSVIREAPLPAFVTEESGRLLACNAALATLVGLSDPEDAAGLELGEILVPTPGGRRATDLASDGDGLARRSMTLVRADGSLLPVDVTFVPVEEDCVAGWLQDVSPLVALEERLEHGQRLQAVGRLAGGVAHDIKNQLTTILGFASLLQKQGEARSLIRRRSDSIARAAQTAADLTQQLMAFSRQQILEAQVFSMDTALADMRDMLRHVMRDDIEIALAPCPDPVLVRADRRQVEHVVLNLALNARDAMPEGGRIEITNSLVQLDAAAAGELGELEPGPYVLTTFADDGLGMDDTTREHIFEAFFTTKGEGEGTGLGLATARRTLRACGGDISCSSRAGEGTTFFMYLPAAEDESVLDAQGGEDPGIAARTIMVAQSDETARMLGSQILTLQGFNVIEREDVAAALRDHSSKLDLLVIDEELAARDVQALATSLGGLPDPLRILYTTGGGALPAPLLAERPRVLRRPFTPEQLVAAVRALLDDGAGERSAEA